MFKRNPQKACCVVLKYDAEKRYACVWSDEEIDFSERDTDRITGIKVKGQDDSAADLSCLPRMPRLTSFTTVDAKVAGLDKIISEATVFIDARIYGDFTWPAVKPPYIDQIDLELCADGCYDLSNMDPSACIKTRMCKYVALPANWRGSKKITARVIEGHCYKARCDYLIGSAYHTEQFEKAWSDYEEHDVIVYHNRDAFEQEKGMTLIEYLAQY